MPNPDGDAMRVVRMLMDQTLISIAVMRILAIAIVGVNIVAAADIDEPERQPGRPLAELESADHVELVVEEDLCSRHRWVECRDVPHGIGESCHW